MIDTLICIGIISAALTLRAYYKNWDWEQV